MQQVVRHNMLTLWGRVNGSKNSCKKIVEYSRKANYFKEKGELWNKSNIVTNITTTRQRFVKHVPAAKNRDSNTGIVRHGDVEFIREFIHYKKLRDTKNSVYKFQKTAKFH
jgi:hypothetical protein